MNVLLIDADSKIPNLALMKLSAYHKALGDDVGFSISDPLQPEKQMHFSSDARVMYQ
ncbi:hypothetical protein [Candidatus Methanomassiliicoccus intestinalis]|uniref:hypothetical protein n=1 Tax=Candidatus Methanomassiliicoccus intestinalis TaxID=1406512 RepID=UPI00155B398A|nr:hypothetical protein [Candidatus Methanomassiliicoccus intestinalis]